jgi:hypothetical protein
MECIVCYENKNVNKPTGCCNQPVCECCLRKLIPLRCPLCRDTETFIDGIDEDIKFRAEDKYSNDPRYDMLLNMTINIYGEERPDLVIELLEEADRGGDTGPMIENLWYGRARISGTNIVTTQGIRQVYERHI